MIRLVAVILALCNATVALCENVTGQGAQHAVPRLLDALAKGVPYGREKEIITNAISVTDPLVLEELCAQVRQNHEKRYAAKLVFDQLQLSNKVELLIQQVRSETNSFVKSDLRSWLYAYDDPAIWRLLVEQLGDRNPMQKHTPIMRGLPLRACDVAYTEIINRLGNMGRREQVIKEANLRYRHMAGEVRIDIRDQQIELLKTWWQANQTAILTNVVTRRRF
jgi:hypothetical protein